MRIAVHDYGGYPFPVELSRELARRGHDVLHLYCASIAGPPGRIGAGPDDPPSLRIDGVGIGRSFSKYSPTRRLIDEVAYGRAAAARIAAFGPRTVLSANAPLLTQQRLMAEARRTRRRFVYWWQDSYGVGVRAVAHRRRPAAAPFVAWPFETLERRMLSRSDRVVAISEGLRSQSLRWGIDAANVEVVPNWAPVDDIVPGAPENTWKAGHGLSGAPVVTYTGTLGLKHDPSMLVDLAVAVRPLGARVCIVSEGPGRRLLEERRRSLGLDNLVLLDYQPAEQFCSVLAAADILVAILEADAGAFSVPSKVLSYLCAGRPVVAALPLENRSAEVIRAAGAGVCVAPGEAEAFAAAVVALLGDPERRRLLGDNGRAYALEEFAREPIADRFEHVLAGPRGPGRCGALGIVAATVRRIWSHPENRGRRTRALAAYGAWQVWERTIRQPWTVKLTPTRRIRCHPHSPIASSVLYYRLPDPMEMRFLLRFLGAGDVFVDVGAHLGVYTVLASSVPGVRIVALEPSTSSFGRLRDNIDLNGIGIQVTAVQVAAGSRCGQAMLSTGAEAMNTLVYEAGSGETVEVTTVDTLVDELGIPRVAAMKIDVEGLEIDVLDGARATIERDRPALVVEVNDPERVASFAEASGYTCVRYDTETQRLTPAAVHSFDGCNALLVADLDAARRRLGR